MRIKPKTGIIITVDSRFRNNTWNVKNVNVVNNAVSLHTFSDNFHRYSLYASSWHKSIHKETDKKTTAQCLNPSLMYIWFGFKKSISQKINIWVYRNVFNLPGYTICPNLIFASWIFVFASKVNLNLRWLIFIKITIHIP